MSSWRVRWALAEMSDLSNVSKHREALHRSWTFWVALLLKLAPHVWPFTIQLRLKHGGVFVVKEFMTLFIYKEVFVDGCYDLPFETSPEPFIVDVGANTGLFIIRMKQLYPRSNVLGYEPLPSNYAQLRRNLELSGLHDVETVMKGVGGTQRREKLYVHRRNIGGHSLYQSQTGGSESIDIDLVDVQGLLLAMNGKICNLLKLDCEGAEREIILSIGEETAARIENILFEATPALYNVDELLAHLERIGYRVGRHHRLYWAALNPASASHRRAGP